MTPISPEDRNKVVLLVVGVVVVFGFAFWRITSVAPGGQAPAPSVSTVASPETTPPTPVPVIDVSLPTGAATVDPFRHVLPETSKTAERPAAPTGGSRPPFRGGGLQGPLLPPGINPNAPLNPNIDLTPKLIGVVTGSDPVAVFSEGGGEVILHLGQKLSSGYMLVSVTRDSAVLRRDGKKITLSINPER